MIKKPKTRKKRRKRASPRQKRKMSAEENKALHCRYFEETNKGNLAVVDELFAANYVFHGPGGEEINGPEAYRVEHAAPARVAFPDLYITAEDMIAEGDRVVTRWSAHGTHKGEFWGIAPTGKQVTITGIIISRIEGGRVIEDWEEIDLLGLLQQLGAVSLPGESKE